MRVGMVSGAGAVLAIVAATGGAAASPASAARAVADSCVESGWQYSTFSRTSLHIPTGIHWKSGPGGTVTASLEKGQSATLGVSIGTSVSADMVVAKAEATFGINASVTSSVVQTYVYTHPINAGKYGNMQFGNWGSKMGLKKYYVSGATCTVTSSYSGTVTRMPSASSWGFRYWETSS